MHKLVSLIVAVAENHVIGRAGGLPWRLREDLRRFKALTIGKPVIMGRKTFESIGRPLPERQNIVMTRSREFMAQGCFIAGTPDEALAVAGAVAEIMVIGGADIYREFLPLAGRIYLTRVHADIAGDARMPDLDPSAWIETSREFVPADEDNEHAFSFITLERQ